MGNGSSSAQTLFTLVKNGKTDEVKQLCTEAADIDVNCHDDNTGATPIMSACYLGYIKIIKILISFGANLKDCDKDECTSLHAAVRNKQLDVVQLLVTKYKDKIDINSRNKQGDTALHLCMQYAFEDNIEHEITKALIKNGASIRVVNDSQQTAVDIAPNNEIKRWLTKLLRGADSDSDCNTNSKICKDDKQYRHRMSMKQEVTQWLKVKLSFPEYVDNFISNGFDRFDAICAMEKDDLKNIGIKLGHIKVILCEIKAYKLRKYTKNKPNSKKPSKNKENEQKPPLTRTKSAKGNVPNINKLPARKENDANKKTPLKNKTKTVQETKPNEQHEKIPVIDITGNKKEDLNKKRTFNEMNNITNSPNEWQCTVCTLLNDRNFVQCKACGTQAPIDVLKNTSTTSQQPPQKKPKHNQQHNPWRYK